MVEEASLADEDYRQIAAFIARTSKGRAFLDEHARRARTIGLNEVQAMVEGLRDAWREHEASAGTLRRIGLLRQELQDMSASISQARREIAAIRPRGDGDDRIATAANELDAIVLSTERASIEILGAAERIQETVDILRQAGAPKLVLETIEGEVSNIYMACSFQDLTGQRTTKVVNALRYIEQRIVALMALWDVDQGGGVGGGGVGGGGAGFGPDIGPPPPGPVDNRPDAHLLNGPSDDGVDQDEIDRLLNGDFPSSSPAPAGEAPAEKSPAGKAPAGKAPAGKAPAGKAEEPITPLDQSSIDALFG